MKDNGRKLPPYVCFLSIYNVLLSMGFLAPNVIQLYRLHVFAKAHINKSKITKLFLF